MAILTKDRPVTTKGARALFASSFITRRRRLVYPKICEVIDSYVESDFAKSFGTVPQLEEIIPDVNSPVLDDFQDFSWTWKNRIYSAKLGMSRKFLDFDQTGQSRTLLQSMAARLANLPDKILYQRMTSNTLTAMDGAALFSASHFTPTGGSAQTNIVTGTTPSNMAASASTQTMAQQILIDFRNAVALMRGFLDDKGQPFHDDDIRAEDLVIYCGPLLEVPMKQAFFSGQINASDNVCKGMVREIISTNYMPSGSSNAASADWYLYNVGNLKRPWIYSRFRRIRDEEIQDRIDSSLTSYREAGSINLDDLRDLSSIRLETNLGHQGMNADADVLLNDRYLISAQWMGEIFPGEWRNAVSVSNAAS